MSDFEETTVAPAAAVAPRGVNHIVFNVRDIEVSHRFWTEMLGFRCVGQLKPRPAARRVKMRFYSGVDERGDVNHHDVALIEVVEPDPAPDEGPWSAGRPARRLESPRDHVARPRILAEAGRIPAGQGRAFHLRINHGMTHSAYISDPDGHGIEVLYELPREVWEGDIEAAQNFSERLPTEGPETMIDREDYPVFTAEPR